MTYTQFAGVLFSMNIIWFLFGLPFAMMVGMVNFMTLFMMSDVIGVRAPNKLSALVLGGAWGVLLVLIFRGLLTYSGQLPFNFLIPLSLGFEKILTFFSVLPMVAAVYLWRWKIGGISVILGLICQVMLRWTNTTLNPDITTLYVTLIFLFAVAIYKDLTKRKNGETTPPLQDSILVKRYARIRKNWKYAAISGALLGAAVNLLIIHWWPAAPLLVEGDRFLAALMILPIWICWWSAGINTGLTAGMMSHQALGFTMVAALLLPSWSENLLAPFVSAIIGVAEFSLFALFIPKLARGLERFATVKEVTLAMQTVLGGAMEVGLTFLGLYTAFIMANTFGLFIVVAGYLTNEILGRPITRMAVAPISCIALGVLLNVIAVAGLTLPVI